MELRHSKDGGEACECRVFAYFDKGHLSELPLHVGVERRERRKGKEASGFDPHLSFRHEKNEIRKDQMACPSPPC